MTSPNFSTDPCFEPLTWAAASGNLEETQQLLARHNPSKDLRIFTARVAAAGNYYDVVKLLDPRYARRRHQ